jgi:hypothetical protein
VYLKLPLGFRPFDMVSYLYNKGVVEILSPYKGGYIYNVLFTYSYICEPVCSNYSVAVLYINLKYFKERGRRCYL